MDKILIVDQNEKNVELMMNLLESSSCKTYHAGTGKTAIARAKYLHKDLDLIVVDSDLPDMSGYDLCKMLKAEPETSNCLVLIMILVETRVNILKALNSGTDDYISKNFDKTIFISKINSLLRISHLNDKIQAQYDQLKERDEVLSFQLKTAQRVQRNLIKGFNQNVSDVSLISKYLPALDIGGDFLKMRKIDEEHISFVLGDVAGHGISAALLTSMLCMIYDSIADKYLSPSEALSVMNAQFCNTFDSSEISVYACVFYAIIDTKNRSLIYANAGQPFPIYVNLSSGSAEELSLSGVPVGMLPGMQYEEKSKEYAAGDMLIVCTDGLSDGLYKEDTKGFTEKLESIMVYSAAEGSPLEDVADDIVNTFCRFDEERKYENDDVSMVLCRFG